MATKKRTTKANSKNRVSYAGIPAKARKAVRTLRAMEAPLGKPRSPQEIYQALCDRRARGECGKAEQAAENARDRRDSSLEELRSVLNKLCTVLDIATAIEEDHPSYLDHHDLAAFARLRICEVGEILEQTLCDFGIIEETPTSCFVGNLKRQPIELQEVAHG